MNTLRIIENKLIEVGANPALSGFYCAMHAINYYIENNKEFYQVSITQDLYPGVAKKLGTGNSARVERNIRHLVEEIFNKDTPIRMYADIKSGKMTNSNFISYMLLQVKHEIEEIKENEENR